MEQKSEQLQIRVSKREKAEIRKAAARAGVDMSTWVLSCTLPSTQQRFASIMVGLGRAARPGYALAELNDFLTQCTAYELASALAERPDVRLDPYLLNYVAAMCELALHRREMVAPSWLSDVRPLPVPHFASELESLRLHLLVSSPPPFRRRNIFVDSSLGDRR